MLEHYKTEDENEVVIMMPVPQKNDQMQLIRAYDLNPLIYLELQHSYLFCHTNAFVSPRRNKLKVFPKEKQMNES